MYIQGVLPDLTKTYLLERVTQEEIMEYYTKVPVNRYTLLGNSFTSPFRQDKNPTCNYYYTDSGKLRLKDWNGSFEGDIFDVVSLTEKINTRTSQGFKLILNKIASDFGIHKYTKREEKEKLQIILTEYNKKQELKVFKIVPRGFNEADKRYWTLRYGITKEMLRAALIIPVQELYMEVYDGQLTRKYIYNSNNPAYAYYGGEENGIKLWRIYFPYAKEANRKFLSNKAFLQGKHLLQPAKFCIITKSYKDALCYQSFGIQAVGLATETTIISKEDFQNIKVYYDFMLSNTDYDKTGVRMANKLKRQYYINPLMFTTGRYNQPNYGVKDFSDFIQAYGRQKALDLILSLIDKYEDELRYFTNYNYESLKWLQEI